MSRIEDLQAVAAEIGQCSLCKQGGTGKAVPGEGAADAAVMFVGEAPGKSEAKTGKPFIGRSGKFLREMIASIGLAECDIFITSPVHYLPASGSPAAAMIEHGRLHLLKQIEIIKPRIIVLLGSTACRALLAKSCEVAKEHGTVVEQNEMKLLITFHPAYANRLPEGKTKFSKDFEVLRELLQTLNMPIGNK
jgi:DNA polymerase